MKDPQKKYIAILGSTGSIGTQALEVIRNNKDRFVVEVLTAENNAALLIEQAVEFRPNVVVIGNEGLYSNVQHALEPLDIKVYCGVKALASVVEMEDIDVVLTALVGYAGLIPTIHAIKAGKHIALANKETLVVAGDIVTALARQHRVAILPVDSEHSAIFQCLPGEGMNEIEKIILTASGGPFRGMKRADLEHVTKKQALKHPNWSMGAKITIDSASLMNKGLEVIEAKWLFGLEADQIDVVVHPQSIIHSMVQFQDGSIKAQMGLPDMKLPIQYALAFPERLKSDYPRFDFTQYPALTFDKPDTETFHNLSLAYDALRKGGNMACILNAANEIAVEKFLQDEIAFLEMPDLIAECMAKVPYIVVPTLDDYIQTDTQTRALARAYTQVKVK
ncbi:1-deoxy-D-xylulose-5-phosphate reductoisomerase [Cytophaga hutchinsonii]|uniref:1-deoxy-D-xylulose 5-phosphate reductoisomerase n=1 Tax=Cytophaga hutchinsonii (strain ATCC 33406 / DSM 1761 / CIP 103989 / NBRC 15051 / NCIMB 9469 / D465) TaxID=269798 RepID=A0A6N4SUT2_CYTH3|nr:1-deoxy-D-xylulose-5-phosphate reductoisomerase [Cytophaga hutchinsonii]ABG60237.1 1-deoxy-D-xylulose 5-phosphate reductoisomerase [Cytophaga hutchinsonii ATCC 33406]SFX21114.1 1-deoxy-D-xylulose 5-phosphate reductoisomerase [Cytophaga hutchinsonii ATCC 33406]